MATKKSAAAVKKAAASKLAVKKAVPARRRAAPEASVTLPVRVHPLSHVQFFYLPWINSEFPHGGRSVFVGRDRSHDILPANGVKGPPHYQWASIAVIDDPTLDFSFELSWRRVERSERG